MTIRLSDRARADLQEIRDYMERIWGEGQWLKYYAGLVATFEMIGAEPERGRDRSLFYPGMRSVSYEKHIVFYASIAAAGGAPVILRIVHQARNLPALAYYDDLAAE